MSSEQENGRCPDGPEPSQVELGKPLIPGGTLRWNLPPSSKRTFGNYAGAFDDEAAPVDGSGEAGETEGLDPKGESAVPEGQAPASQDLKALQAENDHLRASLANSGGPCAYCDLPQDRWTECASGFPGCGRYDDAMLCPNVGAWLEKQQEIDRLTTALAESERKRVEAEASTATLSVVLRHISSNAIDPFVRKVAGRLFEINQLLAATPTQETDDVAG